ncbi:MarR family transcriptional regulator [Brooklawnia sp.]|uniref:MarR family winged helix-turn-helix transcriptional regulator n=1 Tax=Brooklawnia sp. TaxID=2699740 RepID=UPI00311D7BCA
MDLAYELHDLVRTLDREAERILRPEGLNYHRYLALIILAEHPGITGRQLAAAIRVTEAAASGIVRTLLKGQLIEDAAGPGTGNVRHLKISAEGAETLDRCSALLGSSLDENARAIQIDPEQLARTIRALHDELRTWHQNSERKE